MKSIIVGSPPIRSSVIAVSGEEGNTACIVVGAAEGVLHLAGEILIKLASESKFQRISFQIAIRLHLPHLPQRWVRPENTAGNRALASIDRRH